MTFSSYDEKGICNAALVLLGESGINSIENPTTDIEAACATMLPLSISTLLSSHDWNFATPVRQLAVNPDASDDLKAGYSYAYRLPADLLAGPFGIYQDRNFRLPVRDYLVSENHVLSNAEVIHAKYRSRPPVSTWPAYFIDLVLTDLAFRLAKPIADNTALSTELRIRAYGPADMDGRGGLLGLAKSLDSKSAPMRSLFQNGDPLTATRH